MFFSWYARNRHFKRKRKLSGQIFPVLLICLAGLLVAVIVTIGVGEGAKAKTYASNSADAGSLAAASCWAAAFNKLVARNKEKETYAAGNSGYYMTPNDTYQFYKEMDDYYPEMRTHYEQIYNWSKGYLTDTATDNADYFTRLALNYTQQAYDMIIDTDAHPNADCTIWENQATAAALNRQAAEAALNAAKCIGAFYILSVYMQRTTDWFRIFQTGNFCDAQAFMNRAYDTSRRTGLFYAFSNSGTSRLLTSAQGDEFNFWLGSGNFFNASSPSSTYTWGPEGKKCSITATLELPKILSYELKHTKWNYPMKKTLYRASALDPLNFPPEVIKSEPGTTEYPNPNYPDDPFNVYASFQLMKDMLTVYDYLIWSATEGDRIRGSTASGKACCDANHHVCNDNPEYCSTAPTTCCSNGCETNECDGYHDNCPNAIPTYFDPARTDKNTLASYQNCVKTWLDTIVNTPAGTNVTIPTLKQWNIDVFNNVWAEAADFPSLLDCDAVKAYTDVSQYPGMTVINIKSVTLDGAWTTKCTVNTSCEGGGSTTSTSTSQFDGGNVGDFLDDYYSRIISVS